MTEQNKNTDNNLQTKATTLYSILSEKFEILGKLPHMKLPAWYGLVFLALIIIIFSWKQIAVGQVESNMTKRLESERGIISQQAREYADKQYVKEEERFGQVLAWTVRGELIRNNLDQINQYFNELVKMRDTDRVVLISDEGELLVSTDKRLEESDATDLYPKEILGKKKITIESNVDGKKLLIVPIMGLNKSVATLIISYNPTPLKF